MVPPTVTVEEVSHTTGRRMLQAELSKVLPDMDVDTFLDAVDNGDFDATRENRVLRLVMLAPFAR